MKITMLLLAFAFLAPPLVFKASNQAQIKKQTEISTPSEFQAPVSNSEILSPATEVTCLFIGSEYDIFELRDLISQQTVILVQDHVESGFKEDFVEFLKITAPPLFKDCIIRKV